MRCLVRYTNPRNLLSYYFVDFRSDGDELRPVGCFFYRKQNATIFETKREASKVIQYLVSRGYDAKITRYS